MFLQAGKFLLIAFLLILLTACKEEGKIMSVKSIHEVHAKVDEILKTQKPEDVLVALDIDMTLTQPDHPATYYPALKKYYKVFKNIFKNLSEAQKDVALTLTTSLPQRLVEKDSPKIVKDMQTKGVHVIAFTATLSGSWKDSKNKTIFKRRDKLQTMGFDFSFSGRVVLYENWPKNVDGCPIRYHGRVVTYMDFPKYVDGYPMFYHGVLCSNGENSGIGKGKVLEAFLEHASCDEYPTYYIDYMPKVVVMVDDKKSNFEDVQKVLVISHPEIQFVGIEFQGAFDYAPKDISEADFTKFWQGLADQAKLLCPN